MLQRLWLGLLCLISLVICLGLGTVSAQVVESSVQDLSVQHSFIQQGLERYQSGDLTGAIAIWRKALEALPNETDRVILLKSLARAYSQVGQHDNAIATINPLISHYQTNGDRTQLGRILTEQAQAYSNLGQQRRAIALLCGEGVDCQKDSALGIARQQSDRQGEAAGLGSLGNIYRLQGNYEESLRVMQRSLELAEMIKAPAYVSAAKNGLGNTYANLAKRDYRYAEFASESGDQTDVNRFTQQAIDRDRKAIEFFESSAIATRQQNNITEESHALLNLATSYQRSFGTSPQAETTLKQAYALNDRLPDSRSKTYGLIRLANLWQQSGQSQGDPNVQCLTQTPAETVTLLNQAVSVSSRLGDPQAESFALGRLGHLYECQQNFQQALNLTQRAQQAAQGQSNRYLWDWQTGRILQAQGKMPLAIAAYENAVTALKEIRSDLAIASRDVQFDFRDVVEPVYRELTELQLRSTDPGKTAASALGTIDSLRLAELQNYLGEDCTLTALAKPVALVNQKTAVFSTIILKDRVAVLLTLPNSRSIVRWLPDSSQTVRTTVNDLRLKLENRADLANAYQTPAQQFTTGSFVRLIQNCKQTRSKP
jgi:tetratricopeptide (TPR) repeat protein